MKKYLPLHGIALLLLTVFVFIGCSAKQTAPPETAEIPLTQKTEETGKSSSPEAALTDKPHSSEQETLAETKAEDTLKVEVPSGSVLHLIPAHVLGVIYCPSLAELDDRINTLAADLLPIAEPPEVLAGILADAFGAGFESLAELEEIGLDMNQDFAIFMTALSPPDLSATVHLTAPDAMKQVIADESEGTAPVEYKGVTYWNAAGGGGSFAILEDVLVFARAPEICESVIDTYHKTKPAIITKPNYDSFLADVSEGTAQLALHFDLESVTPDITESINKELEAARDNLESDPSAMQAVPFLNSVSKNVRDILNQLRSLSVTLELKGTDVQLAQFLTFKTGSKIQNLLREIGSDQLALLNKLPKQAFINGGFQGEPEFLIEMNVFGLRMFGADTPEQSALLKTIIEQTEIFYGSLAGEAAFSVDYNNGVLPDSMVIYRLKDEQQVRTYMAETFLEQIQNTMQLMQAKLGDMSQLNMYDGAHLAAPIMHNGVEIQTFVFPNIGSVFEDMPSTASSIMPQAWKWSYAFHENQLLLAMGGPEIIKAALDRQTETGETLAEDQSYQKLSEMLGTDNNLLLAISPITAANSILPIIAQVDPDSAAPMQMFSGALLNMPETYSLGFSAKAEENGIRTKILLVLGDFKQLVQMIAMIMQGAGQMQ